MKQGKPLSPLLFVFFVNDLYNKLCSNLDEMSTEDQLYIIIFLFAVDNALSSYPRDLHTLLGKLHNHCTRLDKKSIQIKRSR